MFVLAYVALLGAVIGSFLNVCILRWGAEPKQSVMRPPSRCPNCGRAIRWYENIPIASWIWLRARCAGCGTRISALYPAVEAATALLWAGSVVLLGPNVAALELAIASTLLLGIAVSDARAYIIPHEFSIGGTAIALAFAAFPTPGGVGDAILGALFGAGLVLLVGEVTELVLGQEAMGGGDCALMGMVGAFFGWEAIWPVLALGAFVGLLFHLPVALRRGSRTETAPVPDPVPEPMPAPELDPLAAGVPPAAENPPTIESPPLAEGPPAVQSPAHGIRWGKLSQLLAGGLALGGLLGVAARAGVLPWMLRGFFFATLGAGAAYYVSFLPLSRLVHGKALQIWGLLGAAVGIAIGTANLVGVLVAVAVAAGAWTWASRQSVASSPESTDDLSAQGYLPFGIGLSIAAVILAYSGGFETVREMFAEIAMGLGL